MMNGSYAQLNALFSRGKLYPEIHGHSLPKVYPGKPLVIAGRATATGLFALYVGGVLTREVPASKLGQ